MADHGPEHAQRRVLVGSSGDGWIDEVPVVGQHNRPRCRHDFSRASGLFIARHEFCPSSAAIDLLNVLTITEGSCDAPQGLVDEFFQVFTVLHPIVSASTCEVRLLRQEDQVTRRVIRKFLDLDESTVFLSPLILPILPIGITTISDEWVRTWLPQISVPSSLPDPAGHGFRYAAGDVVRGAPLRLVLIGCAWSPWRLLQLVDSRHDVLRGSDAVHVRQRQLDYWGRRLLAGRSGAERGLARTRQEVLEGRPATESDGDAEAHDPDSPSAADPRPSSLPLVRLTTVSPAP